MTILAVLAILFGIIAMLGGLLLIVAYILAASLLPPEAQGLAGILGLFAVLAFLFGLLWIVGGAGLLKLRAWAWWLTIIASVFNIISSIGSYAVFPAGGFPYLVVLPIIIIIYLITVRGHFGIGGMKPAGM